MTAYYSAERMRYLVNGEEMWFTEEQAEKFQKEHPTFDVQADLQHDKPFPDEAAEDYLDCQCLPDLPNGQAQGSLCLACQAYCREIADEI